MVFDRIGIVLVVVALRTTDGGAHPDGRDVAHAVGGVDGIVFFFLQSAFVGGLQETVVSRGNFLPLAGIF